VVTHKGTSAGITVTKTVTGAAITGLGAVLQIGETAGTITAATAQSGTKVWASSNTSVATINSSTGVVTLAGAGDTTISYTATEENIFASNNIRITVYGAVAALTPVYAAFTGAVGAKATPSNAGAINTAKGNNIAAFAIASGAGAATIDASTGELTMGSGGTITVSLTIITNAAGAITHRGTSESITVTKNVTGAAITGLGGVLQIGETAGTITAATTESGTKVWASSNTGAAAINSSTGVVTLAGAGNTTISYTVTEGNVVTLNSTVITVYGAAVTLNPFYHAGDYYSMIINATAIEGPVGMKALPTNAAAITAATGGNMAVFAIAETWGVGGGERTVGGDGNIATINADTGELTLLDGGTIFVSLVIKTAGGVVTYKGTSESVAANLWRDE
jgi:hypothetical protein